MIHLCTFTTLMLLQNNISQKILFIAARTIQFPGFVFKVCIDLIVAIVTSSIYFDVQKFPCLFENIYISNQIFGCCKLLSFNVCFILLSVPFTCFDPQVYWDHCISLGRIPQGLSIDLTECTILIGS